MDKLEKDLQQVAKRCVAHTAVVMRYTMQSDVNKEGDVYISNADAGEVCVLARQGTDEIVLSYFEQQLLSLGYVVAVDKQNQSLVVSDKGKEKNVNSTVKKSVNASRSSRINTRNRSKPERE